jgi:hypothetical protein
MTADWVKCKADLYWSANHDDDNWNNHHDAIYDYNHENEQVAEEEIDSNQAENPEALKNYKECRARDTNRFWQMVIDVYDPEGPRRDV